MNNLTKIVLLVSFLHSCSMFEEETNNFLMDHKAKVLVFISPDCPLCKSYTKDLREMIEDYGGEIDIYGVVPGKFYTIHEVDSFLNHYNLPLDIVYDPNFKLVRELKATITPEAFLIDNNNTVRYQGLFDNWLGELGRKRLIVTDYYLKDAVESYLNGEEIKIKKTKAIGCFIE